VERVAAADVIELALLVFESVRLGRTGDGAGFAGEDVSSEGERRELISIAPATTSSQLHRIRF
jgi:hypothetical protein